MADQPRTMEVDAAPIENLEDPNPDAQVDLTLPAPTAGQEKMEIGEDREKLSEIMEYAEPSFAKGGLSKATS